MKSRSERQIISSGPVYEGNITSTYENERWVADLISFVSRPVKQADGLYSYILLVQDVFSRYLYARPLVNVTQTTAAFEDILEESKKRDTEYKTPARLDTDGATEFTSERFQSMLQRRGITDHQIKRKGDLNALATLDAAMQNVKKALTRRIKIKKTDWLVELPAVIKGYNDSFHSSIHTEPNDISSADIFALKKQAAKDLQENTEIIEKRQDKLKESGAFRVYLGREGGLKQRADKPKWSNTIHEVKDFSAPGVVEDTEGKEFLTKLTKAVPQDSSAIAEEGQYEVRGSAQIDKIRRKAIQPYIDKLVNLTKDGMTLGKLTKLARKQITGFADEMKKQKIDLKQVIAMFPQNLKLHDGKVTIAALPTGPLDAFSRSAGGSSTPL